MSGGLGHEGPWVWKEPCPTCRSLEVWDCSGQGQRRWGCQCKREVMQLGHHPFLQDDLGSSHAELSGGFCCPQDSLPCVPHPADFRPGLSVSGPLWGRRPGLAQGPERLTPTLLLLQCPTGPGRSRPSCPSW